MDMDVLLVFLLAAVSLAMAVYVHYRLPAHTRHSRATGPLHAMLIAVGLLLGYVGVLWTAGEPLIVRAVALLAGFGCAHVPAFFVLYIKRLRGEYGHG